MIIIKNYHQLFLNNKSIIFRFFQQTLNSVNIENQGKAFSILEQILQIIKLPVM